MQYFNVYKFVNLGIVKLLKFIVKMFELMFFLKILKLQHAII